MHVESCVLLPHQLSQFYLSLILGVDFSSLGICLADPMGEHHGGERGIGELVDPRGQHPQNTFHPMSTK